MKAKLLFQFYHHFKSPNRNTGFIFEVNVCQRNMSIPNSNFKDNFSSYVFGKTFVIIESRKVNVGYRDTYQAKKYLIISNVWLLEFLQKSEIRGLLEKYPTFGREKETGLLGALDT